VDLTAFCDLIDLYTYLPRGKASIAVGKLSPNIFRILSSNQHDQATAEKSDRTPQENLLNRNMELI
jgi:hypothetical protein